MQKCFVDTNVLLNSDFKFELYDKVYLSIISIEELDVLKRDEKIGYQARLAIKKIKSANNKEIILSGSSERINHFLEHGNDNIILSFALDVYTVDKDCVFVTDDYCLSIKAQALGLPCKMFAFNIDLDNLYTGYKEVVLNEEEMSQHYQHPFNRWGLLDNEYLIIKNSDGEVVDKQRWTIDKEFVPIVSKGFKSIYLDDFKPKDVYQMLAIDSLNNTDLTLLYGMAGVGKTQISLSYIMQNIASGKIGKAVIVFNPVKLKNNEQLGYYSGSRVDKILQNSIGGILSSKLGDMITVETLINQGKLMLVPTSDIRGIEISDKDVLYVTEAQNTDAYTMRTILQRAKEGCKIIIEGDMLEQQDIKNGSLRENGMMRVIEVFKGTKYFSCVKLQNVYRSPITQIAQQI